MHTFQKGAFVSQHRHCITTLLKLFVFIAILLMKNTICTTTNNLFNQPTQTSIIPNNHSSNAGAAAAAAKETETNLCKIINNQHQLMLFSFG